MMQLRADELEQLSPAERLALIEQLWDSLADEDLPLTTAQEAELERRMADAQHQGAPMVTWEQLRSELLQRFA